MAIVSLALLGGCVAESEEAGADANRIPLDAGGPSDAARADGGLACALEGLWRVGDGDTSGVLVRVAADGTARVIDQRLTVDSCALSTGRPGSGSASATVDKEGCRLKLTAQESWCFSGEQQCRRTEALLDLRSGAVTGGMRTGQCGRLGEVQAVAPVASRIDGCPFESTLHDGAGPAVRAPSDDENEHGAVGGAMVLSAELPAVAPGDPSGVGQRQAVQIEADGGGPTYHLALPYPLRVAPGDRLWVDLILSPAWPVGVQSAIVVRRAEAGLEPTEADPIWYAAASAGAGSPSYAPFWRADLGIAALDVCATEDFCASEAVGLAAVLVSLSDGQLPSGPPPVSAPTTVPGGQVWLAGNADRDTLLLRLHRGLRGQADRCTETPENVFDVEIIRWLAPTF